ncbi:MAG: polyphosphate kinase 2 family protein [Bacteroidales bacterium]|nr:polyphosphate kinase 2 family protein [Bacteroidales bacterium]
MEFDINKILVKPGKKINIEDYDTKYVGTYTKDTAKKQLKKNTKELKKMQEVFYADDRYSLLIILQASDAAGKDGAIRHVLGGLNPQGCRVHSFKAPSKIELQHDYIWRHYLALPERGMIEIFNRSHYENVIVTKVHPEYILGEKIPKVNSVNKVDDNFWKNRYEQINNFEKHIYENGTRILKFYLNLSKDEQKKRFLARLDTPEKNWKFSTGDLKERKYWDEYRKAFEDMINETSTDYAPWHIIPADNKWFSRIAIGKIIYEKMKSLDLKYPPAENPELLEKARKQLMSE